MNMKFRMSKMKNQKKKNKVRKMKPVKMFDTFLVQCIFFIIVVFSIKNSFNEILIGLLLVNVDKITFTNNVF